MSPQINYLYSQGENNRCATTALIPQFNPRSLDFSLREKGEDTKKKWADECDVKGEITHEKLKTD